MNVTAFARRLALIMAAVMCAVGCNGSTVMAVTGPSAGSGNPALTCTARPYAAKTVLHRLTPLQYQHAILDVFDGRVTPSALYPAGYGRSVTGYSTEEALNQVGEQAAEQIMNAAEAVALGVASALPQLLPCSQGTNPGQACLDTFLDLYAKRAYRRPLTGNERNALQGTFQDARGAGASFTEATAIMSAHLLQTPQFLYWVEDSAGSGRALNAYELASRLS